MIVSYDTIKYMKPPYEITKNILELYGKITQLLGICESLMLVKPEARLRRQNRIRTIQSSLAIEGNTLNIENITAIIDNKSIIGPKKEILEVQNAIKAYASLNDLNPYYLLCYTTPHVNNQPQDPEYISDLVSHSFPGTGTRLL